MQTIYLDISNKGVVPTIYAKQGDVGRKFEVVLTDSGLPYVPAGGSVFSVWYSGASGEGNYTDIGDKSAFSVNGNKVTVEMIAQMLLNDGDGIMSLVLNSAYGKQIGSWNIPYICESVPGFESEEAKEYYTAFSVAVSKLHRVVGQSTEQGGEIFNFYTDPVYTGDNPPKEYPGNTAAKGAHAQNFGTHADGEYSSASGWVSTASGGISDAGGRETEASGYCAVSRGRDTKAPGDYSDAGGKGTEASGPYSFTRGLNTKAPGTAAVANGESTEAPGYCADAGGYKTKAKGTTSFTRGRETEAREYASSAFGRGTVATARNQQARGAWNVLDVPDAGGIGTYAEIVGGGKNDTDRKNIYTLDWFGNAEFAGKVYSEGLELAAAAKTAAKKTLFVTAGSSVTVTLPGEGVLMVSFTDSARRGCVLLQTYETGFYTEINTLLELGSWAFSTDGLNLTISETGGKWTGTACITALGRKNI